MSFASKILGYLTGNGAEVDADNQLLIATNTDRSKVGYALMTTRLHNGAGNYATEVFRDLEVSINKRLRVGTDNLLFDDKFSYAAQNTAVWQSVLTTFSVTHAGGFILLNGGAVNTAAAVANYLTYKHFPCYNGAGIAMETVAVFTQDVQLNNLMEIGLFQAATTAAPLDGVLFRINAAGAFQGVCNYAGAETIVDLGTPPTANIEYTYGIRIEQEQVQFFLDGVLIGVIDTPAGTQGPCQNLYNPIHFRNYNPGTPTLAQVLKIGEVRLFMRDLNAIRPWAQVMAGMGGMGCQGQPGYTMGSTALYTNSLALGAGAAATNTTAALGSGLGGQFALQPTLTAGTDGIISSYQVPAGTAAIPGRSLIITGVWIDGKVLSAFTGGPCYFAMALNIGATAVSLATAEAASAKARRSIPLGFQSFVVTSPVGQKSDEGRIYCPFTSPLTAFPGEFVQVSAKNLGTVTSAGVVGWLIGFDAHFE